ncbi:MAG: DNA recombination/repair protein RecA [Muribaculaceae bacterium]|nr:DNA recombination/repair protein RecA [Muribaculaceae bacterium]
MNTQFISAKRFFNEVKKTVYLYKNLWKECTTALLHAPREVDKTATALNIASDVARSGKDVLYINAEDHLGNQNIDSDNLYIFTPEFESIDDKSDYADLVFEAIEHAVRTTAIRTFVIDSVSRIAALSFGHNASPAYIMKRLVALQVKCKLSILVVANDSTKSTNNALLSLATSEITIDDNARATPDTIENIQRSEPKHATPLIPPMTCQQRRALQRRSAKRGIKSPASFV